MLDQNSKGNKSVPLKNFNWRNNDDDNKKFRLFISPRLKIKLLMINLAQKSVRV